MNADFELFLKFDPIGAAALCGAEKFDPPNFVPRGRNALHLAAQYSTSLERTKELLTYTNCRSYHLARAGNGVYPLSALCARQEGFPDFDGMLDFFLHLDSSEDVVGNAIVYSMRKCARKLPERLLSICRKLLAVVPKAACYRDKYGANILHNTFLYTNRDLQSQLIQCMVQSCEAATRDAEFNTLFLPVHYAAIRGNVESLNTLLGAYPESADIVTAKGSNLIHQAIRDVSTDADVKLVKISYLCSRYPRLLRGVDSNGFTPLHLALSLINRRVNPSAATLSERTSVTEPESTSTHGASDEVVSEAESTSLHGVESLPNIAQITLDATGTDYPDDEAEQSYVLIRTLLRSADPCVLQIPVMRSDPQSSWNGTLPIHLLIKTFPLDASPLSAAADCLRLILGGYPACAAEETSGGRTAYDIALRDGLPPYFLRLLLRADPSQDPVELHRMNWEERRMAMFLALKAQCGTGKRLNIMREMRDSHQDIARHIILFL
jgi:ankyrin repeat protein